MSRDATDSSDLATLIDRAVAGDRYALQDLLLRYHDRLLMHIQQRLSAEHRGSGLAEDILQDAHVVIFRKMTSFEPAGGEDAGFFPWAVRIAENRMLDMLRGLRAQRRGGDRQRISASDDDCNLIEMLGLLAPCNSQTPSRIVAREEAMAAMRQAFELLEPKYREVLRLRYVECLSAAETAARLNRTEGAIWMLCQRGLKRLERVIGDPSQFFSRKA